MITLAGLMIASAYMGLAIAPPRYRVATATAWVIVLSAWAAVALSGVTR